MFSQNEAYTLANDLTAFAHLASTHHHQLQAVLASHQKLIADYRSLLNDYEETKQARGRYKHAARGVDGTPFVVAIIDGDQYVFEDQLVRRGEAGGGQAARMLNAALIDQVRKLGLPPETKIVVRYITNLAEGSTLFHRMRILGSHSRSLAPFTTGFAKSYPLFDVVDSGEKPSTTTSKVRENFQLFADNISCRHMFFAGCNTAAHYDMLSLFERRVDRITLIRTATSLAQYSQLRLRSQGLQGLFRDIRPEGPTKTPASPSDQPFQTRGSRPDRPDSATNTEDVEESQRSRYRAEKDVKPFWKQDEEDDVEDHHRRRLPPFESAKQEKAGDRWQTKNGQRKGDYCSHWVRGQCKYGERCFKRHELPSDPRGSGLLDTFGPPDRALAATTWRQPSPPFKSPGPLRGEENDSKSSLSASFTRNQNGDALRNGSLAFTANFDSNVRHRDPDEPGSWFYDIDFRSLCKKLPKRTAGANDLLPINSTNWRIDFQPEPFTFRDAAEFDIRKAVLEPCASHHLKWKCRAGSLCEKDHSPMSSGVMDALRFVAHERPCALRGKCRERDCMLGHICFHTSCLAMHEPGCRLGLDAHTQNLQVADWVPASVPASEMSEEELTLSGLQFAQREGNLLGPGFSDDDDNELQPINKHIMTAEWTQEILSPTCSANGSASLRSLQPTPAQPSSRSTSSPEREELETPRPNTMARRHTPERTATWDPYETSPTQAKDDSAKARSSLPSTSLTADQSDGYLSDHTAREGRLSKSATTRHIELEYAQGRESADRRHDDFHTTSSGQSRPQQQGTGTVRVPKSNTEPVNQPESTRCEPRKQERSHSAVDAQGSVSDTSADVASDQRGHRSHEQPQIPRHEKGPAHYNEHNGHCEHNRISGLLPRMVRGLSPKPSEEAFGGGRVPIYMQEQNLETRASNGHAVKESPDAVKATRNGHHDRGDHTEHTANADEAWQSRRGSSYSETSAKNVRLLETCVHERSKHETQRPNDAVIKEQTFSSETNGDTTRDIGRQEHHFSSYASTSQKSIPATSPLDSSLHALSAAASFEMPYNQRRESDTGFGLTDSRHAPRAQVENKVYRELSVKHFQSDVDDTDYRGNGRNTVAESRSTTQAPPPPQDLPVQTASPASSAPARAPAGELDERRGPWQDDHAEWTPERLRNADKRNWAPPGQIVPSSRGHSGNDGFRKDDELEGDETLRAQNDNMSDRVGD